MEDFSIFTNKHRPHFATSQTKKEVDRYIEITSAYINLFINNNTTILDVGASDGIMKNFLKGIYFGIDIEPASNIVEKKTIFEVTQKFDLIIFNHTLEHIPNTHDVIKYIKNIINQNGLIFINVPIGEHASNNEGHIALFNDKILNRIMKNEDFRLLEQTKHCLREEKYELWSMYQI